MGHLHREFSFPNLDNNNTERKHSHYSNVSRELLGERDTLTEDNCIPPFWDLSVPRHQASMDIRLLVNRSPRLSPDLLPEEQERMGKRSGDRGERQSIRNSKSGGNK